MIGIFLFLFCAEINGDGYAMEVPHLAHSVLHKSAVWVADVLWQVAEKHKLRICGGQLCDVLYLDPFPFD